MAATKPTALGGTAGHMGEKMPQIDHNAQLKNMRIIVCGLTLSSSAPLVANTFLICTAGERKKKRAKSPAADSTSADGGFRDPITPRSGDPNITKAAASASNNSIHVRCLSMGFTIAGGSSESDLVDACLTARERREEWRRAAAVEPMRSNTAMASRDRAGRVLPSAAAASRRLALRQAGAPCEDLEPPRTSLKLACCVRCPTNASRTPVAKEPTDVTM
mmetsp:Transcript_43887/g.125567  ORF Transcript_43887/g.125567 Transcript_43887/m.125567 type:complete len:219 (+) Transcript_43887:957-1613(+)